MMSSRIRAPRPIGLLARGPACFNILVLLARGPARFGALVATALASACTSEEPAPLAPPQGMCQPGQTAQCGCGTNFGSVTCTPSATWGVCQCAAPATAADAGT